MIGSDVWKAGSVDYFVEREFKKLLEILLDGVKQNKLMIDTIKNSIYFNIDKELMVLGSSSSNSVDFTKLTNYMKKYKLHSNDIELLISELDKDKDGIVSFEDIRQVLKISRNFLSTTSRSGFKSSRDMNVCDVSDYKAEAILSTVSERKKLANPDINAKMKDIVKYLNKVIEFEKKNENYKIQLAKCDDISIYNFMALFNQSLGYITFNDIRDFLISSRIYALDSEITSLITRYDSDKDSKLSEIEISSIILPLNIEYSEIIKSRDIKNRLSKNTINRIRELFRLIINTEQDICKLNKNTNNLLDYFDLLKSDNRDYITPNDMKDILSDYDTDILFNRINKARDNKITFQEVYIY